MGEVAGIDWQTIAYWIVIPFALYAVGMERLPRCWSWLTHQHEEIPAVAVAVIAFLEAVFPLDELALKLSMAALIVGLAVWYIAAVKHRKDKDKEHRETLGSEQAIQTDVLTKLRKDREREFADRARALILELITFGEAYLEKMREDSADPVRIGQSMGFDYFVNYRRRVYAVVEGFAERHQVLDVKIELDCPAEMSRLTELVGGLQKALNRLGL